MSNPFDVSHMAAGYANARPAVHVHIIDRLRDWLGLDGPVDVALDIGCGAGLSTLALRRDARLLIGLDPSEPMVRQARAVAPTACFMTAAAESLPVGDRSIDLMTAAGSLNWVDLARFFPEVRRVLKPSGALAIYDFSTGRERRDDDRLERWFDEFKRRYPSPRAQPIVPEALSLAPYGLRLQRHERFTVGLDLDPEFYLEYVLTETNVAAAVRSGVPAPQIRDWCRHTLAVAFPDGGEVLFHAYLALVVHARAER
jgi:SAM-dependent methyltransferase